MRTSRWPLATTTLIGMLVAGCAFATSPTATTRPSERPSGISATPTPGARPSGAATRSPSLPPPSASASLPIRGSARENSDHSILTAPGPDRGVYVLIPMREAPAVLAMLDPAGRPLAGWPVAVPGATFCDRLLPVADGSVRVICTMENSEGNMFPPIGAYAFDESGRGLPGWPVVLDGFFVTGQVAGDDLTVFVTQSLGDVDLGSGPSFDVGLVTIAANGAVDRGVRMTDVGNCCMSIVGSDGVAYGVESASNDLSPQARVSRVTAVDRAGIRSGWPVSFDGIASAPAVAPGGRIALTVASAGPDSSRVLVFGPDGGDLLARSAPLPIPTAEYSGDTGGCTVGSPQAPVVARDGTVFVYSELDAAIYAVDPSLKTMPGWPFEPAAPLSVPRPGHEFEHEAGYCPIPALPAVGPDRTLYLPLEARNGTVGGSLVAVGPDGRVRAGWPVELKRPGAEFWSVVVGPDGTVYAQAIEPESGERSSATILAIAPDSTVLYTTTVIEP